jgi:MGT family glycosyltransferase
MTRILVYTSPARGHLYPIVPLLQELRSRGHELALRTLASQVEVMGAAGIEAQPVAGHLERIPHDDYLARSQPAKVRRAFATFAARAEHEVPDLRRAIDAERPGAILVDCMAWGALAVAEAWGGPWALYIPFPAPIPSRDTPPFGPGFRPAGGPLGHLRDRLLRPVLTRSVEPGAVRRLNAVRATVGVRPVTGIAENFTLAALALYYTAEPFEYPRRDWPSCIRMVGPGSWDPPAAAPDWLADVDRPLVLVSTSSELQHDRRLVTTALEALADEDVDVVATLPAGQGAGIEVPDNAHVEPFLSHRPLLARAACAITHGGAGVTQKALAAGVPVCVVPFGRDQHEVARRVALAGAGTRLPAGRLTPRRLRAEVREAMTMQPGARRMAGAFAAAGGAVAAADSFEELIAAPRHADPRADHSAH